MTTETKQKNTETDIPEGWVETTLGEVVKIKYGKDHKALLDGNVPCYGSGGIMRGVEKYLYEKPSVLIPRKGTLSNLFYVDVPFWTVDTLFYTEIDTGKILPKYLFYKLSNENLENLNVGSAVPSLTTDVLNVFKLNIPDVTEQKAIADVLSSLDDKIELLREQNITLEKTAQTIFKEWFGKYQVGDELPEGWRVIKMKEIIELFDSKRIPLSKNEREDKQGIYPYHGATSVMDFVDDFLFDGIYLLLAEDGSVMDERGYPVLQYVQGKFWVNNHAHILKGKNRFSVEMLYVLFRNTKISGIVNGAVQLKINQTNLLNLETVIPAEDILIKFDDLIQPIFNRVRQNLKQMQILVETRDLLLPKLMKGEIRVK